MTGDTEGVIKNPSEVLESWLESEGFQRSYLWGRVAMALELITVKRTLEAYGEAMMDFEREQIISVLDTFMVSQGVANRAYELYEWLLEWRKLKFIAVDEAVEHVDPDVQPSEPGRPLSVSVPERHRRVLRGNGRSPDPPSVH